MWKRTTEQLEKELKGTKETLRRVELSENNYRKERDVLRVALKEYGQHKIKCRSRLTVNLVNLDCTCGMNEIFKEVGVNDE